MKTGEHKCPSCSATLPFNPVTQKWDCEYCGNSYTIEELEKLEANEKLNNEEEVKKEVDVYRCSSCGAEVIADETTAATFCVYCGNTSILKDKLQGEFKPAAVIPFKRTKEEAKEAFKNCCKGKIFAPKEFASLNNIEKISGVYIPFWLYDCKVTAELAGTGRIIRSWTSGSYRYTKTDTYRVEREANMEYEKVPVDGSVKFDDDIMQSIEPFIYKDLVDFNMSYMSGFLAEKYDVDKDKAYKVADERIRQTAQDTLKNIGKSYTSISISSHNEDVEVEKSDYVLLPVWMLNIKYNGKNYPFAMNGQTGKLIGDVPVKKRKVISFFFILTAIITVVLLLLDNM